MNPLQKRQLNGLLLGTSCLVASALIGISPALAGSAPRSLPTGGNVVSGNAKINAAGNRIRQTSEKAFIDWSSFSIGAGETVRIKGPNKNAVTVNRVTGVDRTQIDGALRANDNVWLLNGNDILFGKGSIVNVGSLIATTSDLSDNDFKKGKYRFNKGNNPNASVINKGTITARDGGSVILSAAHVANEGVIQANLGTVVLGGANAFTVDLNGDNLIRYQVTGEVTQAPTKANGDAAKALVSNSGKIVADGGTVLMTSRAASDVQDNVINNSGIVEATSVASHNGEVDLDAGTLDTRADGDSKSAGTVDDSGRIDVAGTAHGDTGGTVLMTGRKVVVADGAHIDARGNAGGGTVLIGGEFHGDRGLKHAKTVIIGKAIIDANATHKGDGGKVAIWSRGDTSFDGTVTARGGRDGGNGGYVETSGHLLSLAGGSVTTLAARGDAGTWLIDPYSIEICSDGCSSGGSVTALTTGQIGDALNDGDVTIEADGGGSNSTITWDTDSALNYNSANALSLLSQGAIVIESSIQNSGDGDINLVAGWDGSTGVPVSSNGQSNGTSVDMAAIIDNGAYGANGGVVTIGDSDSNASVSVGSKGGTLTVAADDLFVGPPNGYQTANLQLGYAGSGGGDIGIYLTGDLTVQSDQGGTSRIGNGGSSAHNVTGNITINANTLTLEADSYNNGGGAAVIGNRGGGRASGAITIMTSGDVTMTASVDWEGKYDTAAIGNVGGSTTHTSGDIKVTAGGDLSMYSSYGSTARIGSYSSSANVKVTAAGNIMMNTRDGYDAHKYSIVAIGNYGTSAARVGGNITVTSSNGDITLLGTSFGLVQIGNSPGVQVSGDVTVSAPNGSVALNANYADAYVQIGNLGSGTVSGNISVTAGGAVSLSASENNAYAQIGNNIFTGYSGTVSGDILINAAGKTTINGYGGTSAWIGNLSYGGTEIGDVTLVTNSLIVENNGTADSTAFGDMMASDLTGSITTATAGVGGSGGGNFTLALTGGGTVDWADYFSSGLSYGNGNTLSLLSTGAMTVDVSIQNVEDGNIVLIAGWDGSTGLSTSGIDDATILANAAYGASGGDITIGGGNNDVSVGSRTGATTVAADNVIVDSENAISQIGWDGDHGGDISVFASGNVTLKTPANSECTDCTAQIGNGGRYVSGHVTGNISVTTSGGFVELNARGGYNDFEDDSVESIAMIGNTGDFDSLVSGGISVDTNGGALTLLSSGGFSYAQIGDWLFEGGTGRLSGNITIDAGAVSLDADGDYSSAQIGNGNFLSAASSGAIRGNITIDATTLSVTEEAGGFEEARIGNLGTGIVAGTLDVTTASDILISANGDGAASIGNFSSPNNDNDDGYTQGKASGVVDVNSGGNITVQSDGANGYASIEIGGATSGTVDVTAKKNITETAAGGAGVLIGALAIDNGGVDVAVTSKTGNIDVESTGTDSNAQIGSEQYGAGTGGSTSGNVSVTATHGNITVAANSGGTTQIGDIGDSDTGDTVSGNLTLTAGKAFDIATTGTTIGNAGGGESGSVEIQAATLIGDITPSIIADLPGGDFSLVLTGDGAFSLSSDIDVDTSNNLTISDNGNVVLATSILNSGSGDITIASGNTVTIGGASAAGDVAIGSANGITTIVADNLAVNGTNGDAQLGYNAGGGGDIDVNATGAVSISGSNGNFAQIGDGATFLATPSAGAVTIAANSVAASGKADITGDTADIALASGNLGSAAHPVELVVNALAIEAGGGNAYVSTPDDLSIGVGSDGIDLGSGDLVLVADGTISQTHAIVAGAIDVSTTSGNITLTNAGNTFGDATVSSSGDTSLYDTVNLVVAGADVGGTLTLSGGGNIGQSGAISADALNVTANHGAIALTNTGNTFGDATLSSSGNAKLYDASGLTIAGANIGGTLSLSSGGNIGQSGVIDAATLRVTANHGAIALTDADNNVATVSLSASGNAAFHDSASLKVNSASVGGNLTLLTEGNLTFVSSVQLTNGDLLAVAGWDGTTTSASGLVKSGAYGNNGASIVIGGAHASGDVAVGSKTGTTTLAAANVTLDAENGYAQAGYYGVGSGDIDVIATHGVTLTGGAGAGDYAQIGNGGMGVSGNESGNINVAAGGAVALDGGDGKDAYAQIGHGGADADKNSPGYTNSGNITVEGQTVALVAGAGDESYAQIGNGGFDLGDGLTGQGINEGDITVTGANGVSLAGNGMDGYAQIGNGGDQVNANAGSNSGGSNSGDIVVAVTASGASVSEIAGAGDDAYAQIGNGGFGTNASGDADASNFEDTGTISVSDLTLTGSDTGKDAYAQIGNGDASRTGIGNVSGDITIDAGTVTLTTGSAENAVAIIGNVTGEGTVSGTVTGYTAPSSNNGSSTQGVVTSLVQQPTQTNIQVSLVVTNPPGDLQTSIVSDTGTTSEQSGPVGQLSGDKEGSGSEASDSATDELGQSLGAHKQNVQTVSLIPGVLTQVVAMQTPHGIPPADQDFSSWGNEALWRW